MTTIETVDTLLADLPYMNRARAELLRDIFAENDVKDVLEIGFYHGKSSAFIAAILEEQDAGHLTTVDLATARNNTPNIEEVLNKTDLSHRVTPLFAHRSYTWDLQRLISARPRPQFDFCYFDGGHTWDSTGFGVLLVDMLLRPGGLLLLDDMDWSISTSAYYERTPHLTKKYDADEQAALPVRRVWDLILPHLGYERIREYPAYQYGLARKAF
ncbi:class I SAM-dependent methyltransferase [Cognatishimia sp. SS12]|uniref:class I SAM-dependent methyltransferase n=1 Tax=Cognatishimia sp. SS12 TaxID=2979465 RepID=UPI00232AA175|nr:class I SAM-dependent methyltransferase [Cognatishimia sp. SS12]MDC0739511.1 class I SAM-dependent methyltransferase [Cognatishimia sp. SS12]